MFFPYSIYLRFPSWKDDALSKCFLSIYGDNHTVFTLQLVNVVYHTYSLAYVKPALLVRDAKPLGHDERYF